MARLTIPDEQTFATFTVVTSTTVFPITFSLFAKADLTVLVDGVALDQSAFTFTGTLLEGGGYDGGTVTLNTAVDDVTVRIERNVAPARTSNFAPASSVPVQSVDQALNRLTANAQDHGRRIGEAEVTLGGFSDDVTDTAAAAVTAVAAAADAAASAVAAAASNPALAALKASNLSDLASAPTALTNLGGTTLGKAVFTAASAASIAESLLVRPETQSQASGVDVLEGVTTGVRNTGFGFEALKANTAGSENTAFGYLALNDVTGGVDPAANYNSAFGSFALASVTTGYKNAAFGRATGDNLTTGYHDTALGYGAMHWHTTALNCVGVGFEAVHGGTGLVATAMQGTVGVGFQALYACTGNFNTAVGTSAGVAITTGVRNTAVGTNALNTQTTANDTTAIGYAAGTTNTGSGNIFIGQNADANAGLANVTVIGTGLTATAANSILMGNGQDLLPGSTARDVGSQAKPWNYMIGANSFYAHCNTAVPAGGTTGAGFLLSSTANFGVFFGSGAPTLTAAKGSLYLRTDGSGTSNRMYVNTDSGTTWTAVTTAA